MDPLGSLAEHKSHQIVIFFDVWPYTVQAGNSITFLNSPCIDLGISLYITNYIYQDGYPAPGPTKITATNISQLALNVTSQGAL